MNKFEKAVNLQQKIESNKKLKALELDGFVNGEEKGKTMQGIDAERMYWIVKTQINDFCFATTKEQKLKAIADLCNVAGLYFLLLENPKAFEEVE